MTTPVDPVDSAIAPCDALTKTLEPITASFVESLAQVMVLEYKLKKLTFDAKQDGLVMKGFHARRNEIVRASTLNLKDVRGKELKVAQYADAINILESLSARYEKVDLLQIDHDGATLQASWKGAEDAVRAQEQIAATQFRVAHERFATLVFLDPPKDEASVRKILQLSTDNLRNERNTLEEAKLTIFKLTCMQKNRHDENRARLVNELEQAVANSNRFQIAENIAVAAQQLNEQMTQLADEEDELRAKMQVASRRQRLFQKILSFSQNERTPLAAKLKHMQSALSEELSKANSKHTVAVQRLASLLPRQQIQSKLDAYHADWREEEARRWETRREMIKLEVDLEEQMQRCKKQILFSKRFWKDAHTKSRLLPCAHSFTKSKYDEWKIRQEQAAAEAFKRHKADEQKKENDELQENIYKHWNDQDRRRRQLKANNKQQQQRNQPPHSDSNEGKLVLFGGGCVFRSPRRRSARCSRRCNRQSPRRQRSSRQNPQRNSPRRQRSRQSRQRSKYSQHRQRSSQHRRWSRKR